MLATDELRALEREAFLRATQAERERDLTPQEREAVWAPWISLRVAAYGERLRASLQRASVPSRDASL
jgi:hypothetical protein